MTPQERQMIDELFDRLARVEAAPRDPDAEAAIAQAWQRAPNAPTRWCRPYWCRTKRLKRANARIQELEGRRAAAEQLPRRLPQFDARHPVWAKPRARFGAERAAAPMPTGRPAWNTGQVLQFKRRARPLRQGRYDQAPPVSLQRAATAGRWRRIVSGNRGSGGGRRGRRVAAAWQHSLDDGRRPAASATASASRQQARQQPMGEWDQSSSNLARDAGVNDIGSATAPQMPTAPDNSIRPRPMPIRTRIKIRTTRTITPITIDDFDDGGDSDYA